jgi:hypothetical protein
LPHFPIQVRYEIDESTLKHRVVILSAHLMLRAVLRQQGLIWIDKVYLADGQSQVGKVVLAGPFAMRNALHATTKQAVDLVLRQLLIDTQRVTRPPGAGATPVASN